MNIKRVWPLAMTTMRLFRAYNTCSIRAVSQFQRSQIHQTKSTSSLSTHIRAFHKSSHFKNPAADSTQPPRTEEVVVSRRFFTKGNTFFIVLQVAATIWLLEKVKDGLDVFAQDVLGEETMEEIREMEKKQLADEPRFIPCTYPIKEPVKFYKASDPDWQEFIKLNLDKERKERIREEIALKCLRGLAKNPRVQQLLGADITSKYKWLDIVFPDAPPPEYTRSGLVVGDDVVSWGKQTIPESQFIQIRNTLWPTAIISAAKISLQVLFRLQSIKVKNAIGIELNQRDKAVWTAAQVEAGKLTLQSSKDELDNEQVGQAEREKLRDGIKDKTTPSEPPTSLDSTESGAVAENPWLTPLLLATSAFGADSRYAFNNIADTTLTWKMFLTVLARNWAQAKLDRRPKGSVFIVGQVELIGKRGRARIEVHAAYDPKAERHLYQIYQLKHYFEADQRAKGGP